MANIRGTVSPIVSYTNQPTSAGASQLTEVILPGSPLSYSFTYGTGAGQIDTVWSAGSPGTAFTVSGTVTKNLTSLTSSTGSSMSLARLKTVYIFNNDATNVLTVGGGSNAWTGLFSGTVSVNPGEFFLACCSQSDATGWITSGTSYNLQFSTSASTSVTVVLAGCSI
jgi:hypothetical protein